MRRFSRHLQSGRARRSRARCVPPLLSTSRLATRADSGRVAVDAASRTSELLHGVPVKTGDPFPLGTAGPGCSPGGRCRKVTPLVPCSQCASFLEHRAAFFRRGLRQEPPSYKEDRTPSSDRIFGEFVKRRLDHDNDGRRTPCTSSPHSLMPSLETRIFIVIVRTGRFRAGSLSDRTRPARSMQSNELASLNRVSSEHPPGARKPEPRGACVFADTAPFDVNRRRGGGTRPLGARRETRPSAPRRRSRATWKLEPEGHCIPTPRVVVEHSVTGGDPETVGQPPE